MKKKLAMKSVIGFVCMALMVSVMSFSGIIAGAEVEPSHTHSFVIKDSYPTGPSVSISDSKHRTPVMITDSECACGVEFYGPGYLVEFHSKVYFDLGHVHCIRNPNSQKKGRMSSM